MSNPDLWCNFVCARCGIASPQTCMTHSRVSPRRRLLVLAVGWVFKKTDAFCPLCADHPDAHGAKAAALDKLAG